MITKWRKLRVVEVLEANFGAVNYHKVVEEATPEDREQRQYHSQQSQ